MSHVCIVLYKYRVRGPCCHTYEWVCSKLDHPQRKYHYSKREAFKFEERERERELLHNRSEEDLNIDHWRVEEKLWIHGITVKREERVKEKTDIVVFLFWVWRCWGVDSVTRFLLMNKTNTTRTILCYTLIFIFSSSQFYSFC